MTATPRQPIKPVTRRPVSELVTERLREFIGENDLKPGARLMTERDLAAELGVGRSSVREALSSLRAQGIVEVRHGEGIYLSGRSDDPLGALAAELVATHADHPYIWEARQAIESYAARLAAQRATEADLRLLEQALEQMGEEIADGLPGLGGDRAFHFGVIASARNPLLSRLAESIEDAFALTSETSLTRDGQPAHSLREHRAILATILDRDPERASQQMLAHLTGTMDILGQA